MASSSKQTLEIKLEFGGGTELLLAPPRSKSHTIHLPARISPSSAIARGRAPQPSLTTPTSNGADTNGATENEEDKIPIDMRYLVQHIRREMIVEREELFVDADGQGIRPGILVLINDADWELEGELEYQLQDGDEVCFISTLHGG